MGPLAGIKIIEFAGLGPAPFCAMMLSDLGAEIIRIDRKSSRPETITTRPGNPVDRGRRSLAVDLKRPEGIALVLKLIAQADALLEGFRPGVMERLGLGPDVCLAQNRRLVYGRMTGWGQTGPLAQAAGHDINYIALTGALHAMGRAGEPPAPPLNLVGDYGGGGMLLAVGVLAALLETRTSGKGQIIDAAMTDGSATLMTLFYGMKAAGLWSSQRSANLLDGAAHFYDTYACSDGRFIAIGAIEPQFYALLLELCNIEDPDFSRQMNPASWPQLKDKLTTLFKTRSRQQWCELMEGTDVCFAPVLDMEEAPQHPHNKARETFITRDGVVQPAPAPRFSRTVSEVQHSPARPGEHSKQILLDWGFNADELRDLEAAAAI